MANVKITELTALTDPASSDVLPIVDVGADTTKKVTIADLLENAGDGAAATPAFSFDNDKSVGMWRPGSEQLAFSTSGTTRLFIDSSGRCGIGETNPSSLLHLSSASSPALRLQDTTNNCTLLLYSQNTNSHIGTSSNHELFFDTNGSQRMMITTGGNVGIGNTAPGAKLQIEGTSDQLKLTYTSIASYIHEVHSNGDYSIAKDSSERLRITSAGNLGVGTSSPSMKVNISHADQDGLRFNSVASGETFIDFADPDDNDIGRISYDHSDNHMAFRTNNGERLRITSAGNTGIGTANPAALLHLYDGAGGANQTIRFGNPAAVPYGSIKYSSSGLEFLDLTIKGTTTGYGNIRFFTGSTPSEAATIDSLGRLLVGTSSAPAGTDAQYSKLAIRGNTLNDNAAYFSLGNKKTTTNTTSDDNLGIITFNDNDSDAGEYARITGASDGANATNDYPGKLIFATTADGASSPTERMRIASDGKLTVLGVYSFTTADAANVRVTAAGDMVRSTSSLKYKTDVETLENTYADTILNCRPVWFRSLSATDNPSWGYWGFIAEEVAEIDPRLVSWKTTDTTYDENGSAVQTACDPEPEGVQYDRFVPHLLNLMKRQQQAIKALEQRLTDAGL